MAAGDEPRAAPVSLSIHRHCIGRVTMKAGSQDAVRGKTLRFNWTDGPTKGATHEHVFHEDGTVEWHSAGAGAKRDGDGERVRFADERVADGVRLVSYLSKSGYTLTVALNFQSRSIVGVASNDSQWMPVHGRLEVAT
jgi:hypothetical protein